MCFFLNPIFLLRLANVEVYRHFFVFCTQNLVTVFSKVANFVFLAVLLRRSHLLASYEQFFADFQCTLLYIFLPINCNFLEQSSDCMNFYSLEDLALRYSIHNILWGKLSGLNLMHFLINYKKLISFTLFIMVKTSFQLVLVCDIVPINCLPVFSILFRDISCFSSCRQLLSTPIKATA